MATLVVSATDQSNDYSNCTNYNGGSVVVGNEWIAADETCEIEYINTFLRSDNSVGNCWLEIWNAGRTALITNGTSDTVAVSTLSGSGAVQQFSWSGSLPSITSGTKYHIMLCSNSVDSGGIWWEGGSGNVSDGFYKWEMDYSDKSWANQVTDDSHYIEIYKSDGGGGTTLVVSDGTHVNAADSPGLIPAYPEYSRNGGLATSNGTFSVDVPYPTGLLANDILILQLISGAVDNHSAITDWTKVTEIDESTNATASWYWKRATGSESGNLTCTRTASTGPFFGIISAWRGCATTGTPYEGAASTSGRGTSISSSSITPTANNRHIVCLIAIEDDVSVATLSGGNYSERFELVSGIGTDAGFAVDSFLQFTAAQEVARTATIGGTDSWVTFTFALLPIASGPTTLTVSDGSHAHAAENVTLSVPDDTELVVADCAHAHTADGAGSGDGLWDLGAYIWPEGGTGGIDLEQGTVTTLTVADAAHAHTADNVTVSVPADNELEVADAAHAHSADSPTLVQHSTLTVADCSHVLSDGGGSGGDGLWDLGAYIWPDGGGGIDLIENEATSLTVADAAHVHSADSPTLVQAFTLTVADATHAHTADSPTVSTPKVLSVNNAAHAHTVIADLAELWTIEDTWNIPVSDPSDEITSIPVDPTSYISYYFYYQTGGEVNIYLRYVNDQNHFRFTATTVGGWELVKIIGGSPTTLGSGGAGMFVNGAEALLRINLIESTGAINIWNGDPPIITTTDAALKGSPGGGVNNQLTSNDIDVTKLVYYESTGVKLLEHTDMTSVDDAAHVHSVDSPVLTQAHSLIVDDAAHEHTVSNLDLSGAVTLIVDDSTHAHAADSPTLTQVHALVVDDAAHAHTVEAPSLTQAHSLVVADAAHEHTVANLDLSGAVSLIVDDAAHAHSADSPALTQAHALVIDDATHTHEAESPVIVPASTDTELVVADCSHVNTADSVDLIQAHSLLVDDAAHAHSADLIELLTTGTLLADDSAHAHVADSVDLTQLHVLAVDDCSHVHAADAIVLDNNFVLAVNDAVHSHAVDSVLLSQVHILSPASCLHRNVSPIVWVNGIEPEEGSIFPLLWRRIARYR